MTTVVLINPFARAGNGATWSGGGQAGSWSGGAWANGGGGGGGTVNLSGRTFSGGIVEGVSIRSDGYVRDVLNDANVDTGTDWVIPQSEAPGTYEVKCDVNSGAVGPSSDATGTWLALTTTRTWVSDVLDGGANITISIRDNGGPVLSSAVYVLSPGIGGPP